MALVMTAAPAVEPVTLAEAKAHCRVDGTAEDAYIASLIVTSRLQIEAALGLALITQSWRWTIDAWPESSVLELPMRPVQAVAGIEIAHAAGAATTMSPSLYQLDGRANPARLVLTTLSPPLPDVIASGIAIDFAAGFGPAASDVPPPIRQAALMLVAHWFECREPAPHGEKPVPVPAVLDALLAPYRTVRL